MATGRGNVVFFSLFLVVLVCINRSNGLTKPTSVKLEDNGYTGVVIAIHPEEAENPLLIEAMITMLNDASLYLYEATEHRAYFKNVMILIPDTWEDKPEYQSPRNATFEGADIIIAPSNPRFAQTPHTKHYEGCGKQAVHIHLTSRFMLNKYIESYYGNRGRVLVHEWAHYRWGIFNEYADEIADPDNSQGFYFAVDEQVWKPTRCTADWDATNFVFDERSNRYRYCNGNEVIGYEDGCVSIPLGVHHPGVSASIMSGYVSIQQIVDFCHNDNHNPDAPNKHNRICNSKSNWEVMQQHPDFKDGNSPPRNIYDVMPTIILARVKPVRVVLVLDTSGSMSSNDRISKLASSARNFITSIAVDGSYVGIVDFDSIGTRLCGLTLIDSDDTRRTLADLVPTVASGGTCIGCGLHTALELFSEDGQSPAGGLVLLITDGQDNNPDLTEPYQETYVEEGVVIDAVAFSNTAEENLIDLQVATGGKFYLQTDDPGSNGLHSAFLATMDSGVSEYDRRIELFTDSALYDKDESRSHGIFVDSTVGNKTSFDFSYIVDTHPAIVVTITSPSGTIYDDTYEGYGIDFSFKVISIKFQTAEPGLWTYEVLNVYDYSHEVFTSISTYASQHGVDPIVATSELSGSIVDFASGQPLIAFAEVRQGLNPIIRASVIATIERPPDVYGVEYNPIDLELLDNGAGADITRDDGIYSRYFTEFTGIGYYGIKININNDNGKAIILNEDAPPYSRTLAYVDPKELLKGNIPTMGNATLLLPGMPVPAPGGEPAPYFTRGISGGSSRVPETPQNWKPGDDIIAPSKIIDLVVTSSSYDNSTMTLEFTAPGDDFDSGQALYYIMRMSSSSTELQTNYSSVPAVNESAILAGNLSAPGKFGVREKFVLAVDIPADRSVVSYTFAMHAVDEAGNEGDRSNIAQATLREYIPPPLEPSTTMEIITSMEITTTMKIIKTPKSPVDDSLPWIGISIGVVAGINVIIVSVVIVIKCFCEKKEVKPKTSITHVMAVTNNAYDIP